MKTISVKMLKSVVGDRMSLTKDSVVLVSEALAKDLIKAGHAVEIKQEKSK